MKNLQKSFSRAFVQGTLTGVFMVLTACTSVAWSQCEAGEVALELTIGTDAWGYEMYWEIAPVAWVVDHSNSLRVEAIRMVLAAMERATWDQGERHTAAMLSL